MHTGLRHDVFVGAAKTYAAALQYVCKAFPSQPPVHTKDMKALIVLNPHDWQAMSVRWCSPLGLKMKFGSPGPGGKPGTQCVPVGLHFDSVYACMLAFAMGLALPRALCKPWAATARHPRC